MINKINSILSLCVYLHIFVVNLVFVARLRDKYCARIIVNPKYPPVHYFVACLQKVLKHTIASQDTVSDF